MTILTTHNLGKYFGGEDIFSELNFSINPGDRIALVGPNGEGKTTLLRIMAGLEPPSQGQVQTAKNLKLGYLGQHASLASIEASSLASGGPPGEGSARAATKGSLWALVLAAFADLRRQEVELRALEETLARETDEAAHQQLLEQYGEAQARFELAGGYTYEQTARQVLTGLGFKEADYDKPLTHFSGGEQSRIHLARLLLERPDLMLLDEPTNHLDLDSVEWLENYLQSWKGSMVVVAHDRYFLDKIATGVFELSFGRLETYRGNFSHYVAQRAERFERRKKEYEAQQIFLAREEEFIRRNIAGQRTREAQGRRKRLERLEKLDRPVEHKKLNLHFQTTLRSGDLVLATHNLTVGYPGGAPLFTCPDLEIRRGNCVALLGPNGAGKTTFIKTILGEVEARAGAVRFGAGVKVGYFAQTHARLNLEATVLDEILSVKNLPIGEARNYLGVFLFSGDDVFKPVGALSGGERSRVALAKLMLTGANFLILDEPTNHLDIPSQENLESVLKSFNGTILLVSHDRYFVDALASHTWVLDPAARTIIVIEGGYGEYLAYRNGQTGLGDKPDQEAIKPKGKRILEQTRAEKRAAERKARELAEMERLIEATEFKLAELGKALEVASQAQDVPQLQKLGEAYQAAEARLEELLTQWSDMETA
jgi:ATP-binding cassette subfamily F protein 3